MNLRCQMVVALGSLLIPLRAVGQDSAVLEITVSDTFGEPLSQASVTLTEVGTKRQFNARASAARFGRLPFGQYEVTVGLAGFVTRRERVRIYLAHVQLRIGLELVQPHGIELSELTGHISSESQNKSGMWVRLIPLFQDERFENAVTESGEFVLSGMPPGRYVLLVLQEWAIVATKELEILPGKHSIQLAVQ